MIVVSTMPIMVDPLMAKNMSEMQLLPATAYEARLRIATLLCVCLVVLMLP